MNNENIKNIIFDLGGVIIHIDPQKTIDEFIKLGAKNLEGDFTELKRPELFDQFECGDIDSEFFLKKLKSDFPESVTKWELIYAWNALLLEFPEENLNLLANLKGKYRTFLLSNTSSLHVFEMNKRLSNIHDVPGLSTLFEKVWCSFDVGLIKPDEAFFEFVLKDADLNPSETLFIDDSKVHCGSAHSRGLNTLHFPRNGNLRDLFTDDLKLKPYHENSGNTVQNPA